MARKKKKFDDDEPKKKSKSKARYDEDEDDFDDDAAPEKPSRNDAYTGMLVISLVCLIAASVFLFLDQGEVTAQPLSAPSVNVPALGNAVTVTKQGNTPPADPGNRNQDDGL